MKDKVSNSFKTEFGVLLEKHGSEKQYFFDERNFLFEKYAGLPLYNPTKESLEKTLKNYILQGNSDDIKNFPKVDKEVKWLDIDTENDNGKTKIKNAKGNILVKGKNFTLSLPFVVKDSELLPLDIISMGNDSVPYSDSNLVKLLYRLDSDKKINQDKNPMMTPFIGVEKAENPSTATNGFMDGFVRLRSQLGIGGKNSNLLSRVASENYQKLENLSTGEGHLSTSGGQKSSQSSGFKKVSSSEGHFKRSLNNILKNQPVMLEEQDYDNIESVYKIAANQSLKDNLEKLAAEDVDETDLMNEEYQKFKNKNFRNITNLPDGTIIAWPERCGNSIKYSHGMIIKNLSVLGRETLSPDYFIVISDSGKIAVLNKNDSFLGYVPSDGAKKFSFKSIQLKNLPEKMTFSALLNDGSFLCPSHFSYKSIQNVEGEYDQGFYGNLEREDRDVVDIESKRTSGNNDIVRIWNNIFLLNKNEVESRIGSSHPGVPQTWTVPLKERHLEDWKLSELPGTFFNLMSYSSYITDYSKKKGRNPSVVSKCLSSFTICSNFETIKNSQTTLNNQVITADKNAKVLPIIGAIQYPRTQADLDAIVNIWPSDIPGNFVKIAADESAQPKPVIGNIQLSALDRNKGIFDMHIRYKDQQNKMFKNMKQDFQGISKAKTRAILKILGYNNQDTSRILLQARNKNETNVPLPDSANSQRLNTLQGGIKTNISKQKLKDTVNSYINPSAALTTMSLALSAKAINDMWRKDPKQKAKEVANVFGQKKEVVQKEAMERGERSTAICQLFEKYAQEHQSDDLLDMAKIARINVNLSDMLYNIYNNEVYRDIDKYAQEIIDIEPYLGKLAMDLVKLRGQQFLSGYTMVDMSQAHAMVDEIELLYKTAQALKDAVALTKEMTVDK